MISTFEASAKQFGAEVEIESTRAYDAFVIANDHPHILSIKSAFEKLGVTANTKRTGGGSVQTTSTWGLTTINLSTGMAKVHTTEEYIAVKDMVAITEFVVAYVTQ